MMESTTFVLLWDEIFEKILEHFSEILAQQNVESMQHFLQKALFEPLTATLVASINYLFKILSNPYFYIFWNELLHQIAQYIYVGIMCYLAVRVFILLLKILIYANVKLSFSLIIKPFKQFLFLQILHFVVLPIIEILLNYYPKFCQDVIKIFQGSLPQTDFLVLEQLTTNKELAVLEIVCLVGIFILCLWYCLQLAQQGFQVSLQFIKCYLNILYADNLEIVAGPLKQLLIQLGMVFTLQRVLFLEVIYYQNTITDIQQLLIILGLLLVVCKIPQALTIAPNYLEVKVDE